MDLSQLTPAELASTPAGIPPPGQVPNFINPPSRSPGATAAIAVMLAITLSFLAMRLYSRIRLSKQPGLDDWAAVVAAIFVTGVCGLTIAAFNLGGLGPHGWNVPLIDIVKPAYTARLFALQVIGPWANFFAKLSILLFLLRLFPVTVRPWISYAAYIGIALNVLFNVILTLYTCILCAPRPSTGGQEPAKCGGNVRLHLGVSSAAVNAFLDIYLLCISVPSLWTLQMPFKKKIGVALILCTGLLACVCSLLTWYFRSHYSEMDDPTWIQVEVITVGVFEPLVALTTACLPALPILWATVSSQGFSSLRHLFSRSSVTRSNRTNQSYRLYERTDGDVSSAKSLNSKPTDLESGAQGGYNKIWVTDATTISSTRVS